MKIDLNFAGSLLIIIILLLIRISDILKRTKERGDDMISSALAILETEEQRNELSKVYSENKGKLYGIALSKLHNHQDAEEAIQEAFLRIANKPDKFFSFNYDNQIHYLCAIIRNVSIDMFLKVGRNKSVELTEDIVLNNDYNILENSLLDKISHDELLSFISKLPELQRNVLILTCLYEHSISETADILKTSKNVVSQRLYLARKAIKTFIEERNKNDG